jgi:5-methylcytosine-specific restriction endonuclease McrA
MPRDAYYNSREWKQLRQAALVRDLWKCAVQGCRTPATVVDHIIGRRQGGPDALSNLRCLCAAHDSQTKEDSTGKRRSSGKAYISGHDAKGIPLDLSHWWNKK